MRCIRKNCKIIDIIFEFGTHYKFANSSKPIETPAFSTIFVSVRQFYLFFNVTILETFILNS